MEVLIIPLVIILGMMGGQFFKASRRYILPISSVLMGLRKKKERSNREYFLLLLMAALSIGYGENSKLYKLTGGRKWLVRLIYGSMVGSIIALAGFVWALLIMPLAYMVRFPYSFKIGKYDFLWQDFYTFSLMGLCIWRVIC